MAGPEKCQVGDLGQRFRAVDLAVFLLAEKKLSSGTLRHQLYVERADALRLTKERLDLICR